MKKLGNLSLGLMVMTLALNTVAADLKAPIVLPSAKVLPKGVRNLSFKGVLAGASDKFNNTGNTEVLANPMFTDISFKTLIDGKSTGVDKGKISQAMMAVGASEGDVFGGTTGQVNVKASARVPVLAWGLSKKFTMAVAVPVMEVSKNVDTGVVQTNSALFKSFRNELQQKGATDKEVEFVSKMADPICSKAFEYGYTECTANTRQTDLGDIKLVGKSLITEDSRNVLSLQTELTLPTGRTQDLYKVVDVAPGDGQWDVGFGAIHDLQLNPDFTLSSTISYTVQMPDHSEKRIWEKQDSSLTPDIDPATERDLGDQVLAQAALKYNRNGINVGTGYTFQYKGADLYNGTKYESGRYDWLEQNTIQYMHTLQASVGYDTISLFKAKKFPVPLSLSVNHTRVVSGKNVVSDPLTSLDFSMFF